MSTAAKTSAKRVSKKTDDVVATPAPVVEASASAAAKTPAKKVAAAKPAAAVVPAAAAVAAPAAPSASAPATKAAAPVAAVDASGAAVAVPEEVRLEQEVKSITARLLAVREIVSELISESKRLEKKAAKTQKMADKRRRRKAPVEGEEGKPVRISIFQVPVNISPALCAFLGRPSGSQESRSNVTKFITAYVKDNNLKNKHDINPDTKLRSLLGIKEGDKLTYFNLQKYLNVHYIKNVVVPA